MTLCTIDGVLPRDWNEKHNRTQHATRDAMFRDVGVLCRQRGYEMTAIRNLQHATVSLPR